MSRPGWDEYFLNIARRVSERGTCVRRKVGCVLINEHHDIIGSGYNGRAAGVINCLNLPCEGAREESGSGLEKCEAIHAEQNALIRCTNIYQIDTVYCTVSPCVFCVNLLTATPAKRIVFLEEYSSHSTESRRRWGDREWVCKQHRT